MAATWTKNGNEWTTQMGGHNFRIAYEPELPFIKWHWYMDGQLRGSCSGLVSGKAMVRNELARLRSGLSVREWAARGI